MDFYSDLQRTQLAVINQIKPLPAFVKNARVVDKESIPEHHWAYMEKLAFPMHDPASTYLSFAYYCFEQNSTPEKVKEELVKRAMLFGIVDDIKDFAEKYTFAKTALEKEASLATYALPGKYPLANREQVSMAMDHFDKHYRDLDIKERVVVANRILEKTSQYNIPQRSSAVNVYAMGDAKTCNPAKAATKIAQMGFEADRLIPEQHRMQVKKAFYDIGSGLQNNADGEVIYALVKVAEDMQEMLGIRGKISDPFQTVFNMTVKEASEMVEVVNIGDQLYNLNDLAAIPEDVYSEALGEDFYDEVSNGNGSVDKNKLLEIIPTLPKQEMDILKQVIDIHLASENKEGI